MVGFRVPGLVDSKVWGLVFESGLDPREPLVGPGLKPFIKACHKRRVLLLRGQPADSRNVGPGPILLVKENYCGACAANLHLPAGPNLPGSIFSFERQRPPAQAARTPQPDAILLSCGLK